MQLVPDQKLSTDVERIARDKDDPTRLFVSTNGTSWSPCDSVTIVLDGSGAQKLAATGVKEWGS